MQKNKLSIQFATTNAAFENGARQAECIRILSRIIEQIGDYEASGTIRDSNENLIGQWGFEN